MRLRTCMLNLAVEFANICWKCRKSHLFGNRQESHATTFFGRIMKKETYPLLFAVVGGMVLAGWFGIRHVGALFLA